MRARIGVSEEGEHSTGDQDSHREGVQASEWASRQSGRRSKDQAEGWQIPPRGVLVCHDLEGLACLPDSEGKAEQVI